LRRFIAQLSNAELERRTGATKLAAVAAALETSSAMRSQATKQNMRHTLRSFPRKPESSK